MTKAGPDEPAIRERLIARLPALVAVVVMLHGCTAVIEKPDGPGSRTVGTDTPDAVPRDEPLSRYGNPASYEVFGKTYYPMKSAAGFVQKGIASWYGEKFHGRKTSSGEVYDMYQMTAAHKQLPLPTYVEVRNLDNGRVAVVKVNDRGPFHENRIIDLSYAAARKLGIVEQGTGFVEVRAVSATYRPGQAVTQAVPGNPGAGQVYLQIGAFREPANAHRLADRVRDSLPFEVLVREVRVEGSRVFRVHIGPIVSVENADRIVSALRSLDIVQSHFVGLDR